MTLNCEADSFTDHRVIVHCDDTDARIDSDHRDRPTGARFTGMWQAISDFRSALDVLCALSVGDRSAIDYLHLNLKIRKMDSRDLLL